jgi:hypothetical protein
MCIFFILTSGVIFMSPGCYHYDETVAYPDQTYYVDSAGEVPRGYLYHSQGYYYHPQHRNHYYINRRHHARRHYKKHHVRRHYKKHHSPRYKSHTKKKYYKRPPRSKVKRRVVTRRYDKKGNLRKRTTRRNYR